MLIQEFNRRVSEGFQVTPLWHQGFIRDDGRLSAVFIKSTTHWWNYRLIIKWYWWCIKSHVPQPQYAHWIDCCFALWKTSAKTDFTYLSYNDGILLICLKTFLWVWVCECLVVVNAYAPTQGRDLVPWYSNSISCEWLAWKGYITHP